MGGKEGQERECVGHLQLEGAAGTAVKPRRGWFKPRSWYTYKAEKVRGGGGGGLVGVVGVRRRVVWDALRR